MIGAGNTASIKDRIFPNYDGGGGRVCGFFWFVCLELLGRGDWGFEVFQGLVVCLFWLVGLVLFFSACYCTNMFMK